MAATSRRTRRWLGLTALVAVTVLGVVGVGIVVGIDRGNATAEENRSPGAAAPGEAAREDARIPVTVGEVSVQEIQRTVRFVGDFLGYHEVTVMAEVPGRVVEIVHDVGDTVRPGDVLLRIDPTDYALALQETWRALVLEATRIGLPVPQVEKYDAETVPVISRMVQEALGQFDPGKLPAVVRARQQEENARRRADRAHQLLSQSTAISRETYETSVTDYEVARANRAQAELDAQAVVAGIRHRLVLLKIADEKLRRTQVVVPTPTGRDNLPKDVQYAVAKRNVSEGEMLKDAPGASTAVFHLVVDQTLKLNASVSEEYAGEVKVGQKVEIRDVEAYPDRTFEGKVTRISPVVDRVSHAFAVEATVANPQRELKPGSYAKGAILTRRDPQAIVVPISAVVSFVGSTRVFVVRDGKAHAVPVVPGVEGRGWVELVGVDRKEISPGVSVITSGQDQLAEGTLVRVRQAEHATAGQASATGGKKLDGR